MVCRKCERWNLTPFDDRWEAMEQCEKLFRDTRTRLSTDQIGLARLKEGTELVRIGEPLRPEFAAWRYGDQFGRRRRKHLAMVGLGATVILGVAVAPLLVAGTGVGGGGIWNFWNFGMGIVRKRRVVALLSGPKGQPLGVTRWQIERSVLSSGPDTRWRLLIPTRSGTIPRASDALAKLDGAVGLAALQKMLPLLNRQGANRKMVGGAVQLLEEAPGADDLAVLAARRTDTDGTIGSLPQEFRLALEMGVHEAAERRWLAGQLLDLEQAWRNAEEIAAIADTLGIPADIEARLEKLRVDGR